MLPPSDHVSMRETSSTPDSGELPPVSTATHEQPTRLAEQSEQSRNQQRIPSGLRRLFVWAPFITLVPYFVYALAAYYAAIQVQHFDAAHKVEHVALVSSLSAIAAMVAQPLVGVLSDRTRSRFGARRPWMLIGVLIGAVGLLTAGVSGGLAMLIIAIVLVQFGFNVLQGPLSAILPDRVPENFRGRYSTLAGLGVLIGSVAGPIFGSALVGNIPVGYTTAMGFALLVVALFLVTVPEADNRGQARAPFSFSAFMRAFWVNPFRYPDFFWGFLGRILLFGGYNLVATYQLYIAQDYVGLSLDEAQKLVPLLSAAVLPGTILGTLVSGPLSDRLGRRKPLVFIAGILIVAAAIVPLVSPTVTGLFAANLLVGLGFGVFVAVDQALMSSVLPNAADYGKDLGVLNIAATLPNVVAPALASAIVLTFGNYGALYAAVAIIAFMGALAILPIKSVR